MDNEQARTGQPAAEPMTEEHVTIVKARNKRISLTMITLCVCMVLAAAVITAVHWYNSVPKDDGLILDNVYVGGINIGTMTKEEAEYALRLTVEAGLTGTDMVVRLDYDALTISPSDVALSLNVKALVEDAYSYGRNGTNAQNKLTRLKAKQQEHHIALLPYMSLDLNKIYDKVKTFCAGYRTDLVQPSVTVVGERPTYGDSNVTHQKLVLTMGTPQANLTPDDLYSEILDGYSLFNLELYYNPPVVVWPEAPDAQAIFDAYCVPAQDAVMDNKTLVVVKPEVYGYGFNVAALQRRIDRALDSEAYGQQIEVTLEFLMPDITAEALAGSLFKDTLATYTAHCPDSYDKNRNKNLLLACQSIDGYVIKVGESFDFNAVIGRLSTVQGYLSAPTYSGSNTSTIGGGVGQVSSALYYCALLSELQIDERNPHRYAMAYTPMGTDAAISTTENLVFTNNTTAPIRILASVSGSSVTITLLGTDTTSYTTAVEYEIVNTYEPHTSHQLMPPENTYGYKDGEVIQAGLVGYEVNVYLVRYTSSGTQITRILLHTANYASRDEIVVRIGSTDSPEELPPDLELGN